MQVLPECCGCGAQVERMKLCTELWQAGIRAEFGYKRDQNFNKDIVGSAQSEGIPVVVLFGAAELEEGNVNVKDMGANTQETVARGDLCKFLQEKFQGLDDSGL
jgi:histidyl-tRNA synthetase